MKVQVIPVSKRKRAVDDDQDAVRRLEYEITPLAHAKPSVGRWVALCRALEQFCLEYPHEDEKDSERVLSASRYMLNECPKQSGCHYSTAEVTAMSTAYAKLCNVADGRFGFCSHSGVETENILFNREHPGETLFRETIIPDVKLFPPEDRIQAISHYRNRPLNNAQIDRLRSLNSEVDIDHDERYSELDGDLSICAQAKPSICRYNMLSNIVVRGLTLASEGVPDFEVWKSDWLTAALRLLEQNPCPNGVNFAERQQLLDGIAPIVRKLQNLIQLQQSADPEMLLDEYDYFYQSFQESVLQGCIKRDSASGKMVISISYDFLTHEEGAYGWAFDPLRIQLLAQHCAGIDSIEKYKRIPIPKENQELLQALNAVDGEKLDHRAMACLLSVALEEARPIVQQIEDANNHERHLIIADASNFQNMLRPFFAVYYKPFTRSEPIELDDGTSIDANVYLEELIALVERFVSAIVRASRESEVARKALNCWREMLSLYRNRLAHPYQQLVREAQEDYWKKVSGLNNAIVECASAVEHIEKGQLSRYYKQEELLAIYSRTTPNLGRFTAVCKLIMSGIDLACEGHPDFDVHKTRWLAAALQLLCENPFSITHELASLHDVSIIKMAFEPVLPHLDTLVTLYQKSHPGCRLPDFLKTVYDIVEENVKDTRGARLFHYSDAILFDEELWGWRFNCRNITRLSQCCTAPDAVQYFREVTMVAANGLPIDVAPYTRDNLYVDYYVANELMFRECTGILEGLLSQLASDDSNEQKCSILDNTSVITEALKPLYNTYYLPYTKYRQVYLQTSQTDMDVPAKCENYLLKVEQLIFEICKFAGNGPAAQQLKNQHDGVVSSYRLRLKHAELPLSCVDQRTHLKKITEMLASIFACNAAVRAGKATEEELLNDPKVATKVEEIITREHEITRSTILRGVKDVLLGWIPWAKSKQEDARSPRSEQLENKDKLTKYLRTTLFSMLGLSYDDQMKIINGMNGKTLSEATGIRPNTIGTMITLKWKRKKDGLDSLLQLLYIIICNDHAFRFFEKAAKGSSEIWAKKSDEELYKILKELLNRELHKAGEK